LGKDLPDSASDVNESILKEIIACIGCHKKYKIIKTEYSVLKSLNLPIPDLCPKCRDKARFAKLNMPRFYKRNCAKCNKDVTTAFAPDRSEIIYCEQCYQQEVV